jgi:phosphatidylglycerophosphatase A
MPRVDKLKLLLATGLGTGYLPVAPGTWASAAVSIIYIAMAGGGAGSAVITAAMVVLVVLSSAGCIWTGGFAEQHFGHKDPHEATIDEWAGQALSYAFLPLRAGWPCNWPVALVGFLAFRLFDILKPPPANGLQRLPRGWGILVDDLVAGVYANILTQVVFRVIWRG